MLSMRVFALALVLLPKLSATKVPDGPCKVGEEVQCPGSPHYPTCRGNVCCPQFDGSGSFVCPSAAPGWNECNQTKRFDCLHADSSFFANRDTVEYFPHFDTSPDYLEIAARAKGVSGNPGELSDNYYLVVGDWGGCGFDTTEEQCRMQHEAANKMLEYVRQRKEGNPNSTLLFVLAVGDNFYDEGAGEGYFNHSWAALYAPELLEVPWFAVMGNHDYGNNDNTSACPSVQPRFVCDESNLHMPACGGARPYSTRKQGYSGNQLNADKGGIGGAARANFHMPDYTYYYTIPELKFELIALDWNWLAGYPSSIHGFEEMSVSCGSPEQLSAELKGINDASTELLFERSSASEQNNVAIISHYPDQNQGGANFREMFLDGISKDRLSSMSVFNFFGHIHHQQCYLHSPEGLCTDFLTGGGGGNVPSNDGLAGFVAVSFSNENASQVTECFLEEPCTFTYTVVGEL